MVRGKGYYQTTLAHSGSSRRLASGPCLGFEKSIQDSMIPMVRTEGKCRGGRHNIESQRIFFGVHASPIYVRIYISIYSIMCHHPSPYKAKHTISLFMVGDWSAAQVQYILQPFWPFRFFAMIVCLYTQHTHFGHVHIHITYSHSVVVVVGQPLSWHHCATSGYKLFLAHQCVWLSQGQPCSRHHFMTFK